RARRRFDVRAADAVEFEPAAATAWHVDPDRRSGGARSIRPESFSPPWSFIETWIAKNSFGAVKLAPGTQPPTAWRDVAEWEWISRDRRCRQLVGWFGAAALRPGRRSATVLVRRDDADGYRAETFTGNLDATAPSAERVGRYLVDLDPSMHAADLTIAAAQQWQLATVGCGGAYLTGDAPVKSALAQSFAVQATLPLRERGLAKYLRQRGVGSLEIKVRGIDVAPGELRKRLKLVGDNRAVLILTRVERSRIAVVAERLADPR
ncbi:MAG: hypothetical protein AAF961_17780, partial [Planctomycetota bacterium]